MGTVGTDLTGLATVPSDHYEPVDTDAGRKGSLKTFQVLFIL